MSDRTYPVPKGVSSALLGSTPTIDDIDLFVQSDRGGPAERVWAKRVRDSFVRQQLDRLDLTVTLPWGAVVDVQDTDVVVGMYDPITEQWWTADGSTEADYEDFVNLSAEEVAFAAAAFGCRASLALRANLPVALIRNTPVGTLIAAAALAELPSGAKVLAVVDTQDRAAVLDLIAVAPGPVVYKRNDGQWYEDKDYLYQLRSIKPPAIAAMDDENVLADVISQIDESTRGKAIVGDDDEPGLGASAYDQRWAEMEMTWWLHSLTADAGKSGGLTSRMPNQLQRYWLAGPGAAKIRWGTPGAMTRCHRHLMKHMTSKRAYQTCNNISKMLGGKGIAWDVGRGRGR